jgi:hypothetical protein
MFFFHSHCYKKIHYSVNMATTATMLPVAHCPPTLMVAAVETAAVVQ